VALTMIDEYEVLYAANTFVPRIWLKADGNFIGQLVFMPDGSPLPDDTADSLYYHLEDFENAYAVLSGDKPVYLLFSGSGTGYENGILTAPEPVGEGISAVAM
jgi:hypothetical protein